MAGSQTPKPIATPESQARPRSTEPYEGIWAKTKKECLDKEGPNSRTLIDLGNVVDGKPTPIFDQYENHCLIERKSALGETKTLTATCFEFWEYFMKREEGRKTIIKLSSGKDGGLIINGANYLLCESLQTSLNAAPK